MKFLHLDNDFTPFGKSITFEAFTFNGGEPHIKILEKIGNSSNELFSSETTTEILITTRIRSFNDLGFLLVATDALRRMGVQKISLLLPYFPAARQDRVMVKGEPLTVKIYADLINNCQFEKVYILDPHSDVTPALLHRVHELDNHHLIKKVVAKLSDFLLISPDGGALKKIYKTAQILDSQPVIECSKVRDVRTGQLSDFKVNANDLGGKTCVIVDDICDGGGTFLGLAKALKKKNAGQLILVVTHGIFSKGLAELRKVFTKIYCTDSFQTVSHKGLIQISINDLLKPQL